jgi:hypothetical protein
MLELIIAAVSAIIAASSGATLVVLRRKRRAETGAGPVEHTSSAVPGTEEMASEEISGSGPSYETRDVVSDQGEVGPVATADPFGDENQEDHGLEGDEMLELDLEDDEMLSERWEAALSEDDALFHEPLEWEAVGPAPIPLFETIVTETPFATIPRGVASLLEPEGLDESSDAPVEFTLPDPEPQKPGLLKSLFRRRSRRSVIEPVLITEDRAFQSESNESRSKSAYNAPIVELDPAETETLPAYPTGGYHAEQSEAAVQEPAVVLDSGEDTVGVGESATLPEPAELAETDFRDISVLEITAVTESAEPAAAKRSRFRRRVREAEIEKLEVGQWESWNAPDAFGDIDTPTVVETPAATEPENAIIASALPELPLSFELDDLPDDFDTEISFLGPSFEIPHNMEDGVVIAAPVLSPRSAEETGRRFLKRFQRRRGETGTTATESADTSNAGAASWFDASVRGGPAPALTPGDIVDYTRYDLPEAIPDRVAVVAGSETGE